MQSSRQTVRVAPWQPTQDDFRIQVTVARYFIFSPSNYLVHCVHFAEPLSVERLQRAIAKTLYCNALLSCRLEHEGEDAWYVPATAGGIQLTVAPRPSDDAWLQEVCAEQTRPFNMETGPLWRVTLLQGGDPSSSGSGTGDGGSNGGSDLICTVHHCLFDAGSLAVLMARLLHYLAEPDAPVEHHPAAQAQLIGYFDGMGDPPGHMATYISKFNAYWLKHRKLFDWNDYYAMFSHYAQTHEPRFEVGSLDKAELTSLLARCHEHGTTFGGALLAACAIAQKRAFDPFKGMDRLSMSADLRGRMGVSAEDNPLCLSRGTTVPLAAEPSSDFWSLAQEGIAKVRDELDRSHDTSMLALTNSFMDALPFVLFGYYRKFSGRLCVRIAGVHEEDDGLNLVSVGVKPLPVQVGPYHATRHVQMAPKFTNYRRTLTALTVAGNCQVALAYDATTTAPAQAQRFLAEVLRLLREE
jgi:hypothetical protein